MSKPSEKAMQLVRAWCYGTEADLFELIDAELEAQHRKTWALAMEMTCRATRHCWSDGGDDSDAPTYIRALPCPPIEATKDK